MEPPRSRDYLRKMKRIHTLAHYLHRGGEMEWDEDPKQGIVTPDETLTKGDTLKVDGKWSA